MIYDGGFLLVSLQEDQPAALAAAAFPGPTPMDAPGLWLSSPGIPNCTKYNSNPFYSLYNPYDYYQKYEGGAIT